MGSVQFWTIVVKFGVLNSLNKLKPFNIRQFIFFLGVHRYAPLPAIDRDMGRSSYDTRRKVAMFRHWNRLIDMDDSRLPEIVLKWDVDLGFINSW